MKNLKEYLASLNLITPFLENRPLSRDTTIKTGGATDFQVLPTNILELQNVLKFLKQEQIPFLVLGKGSNLIFTDKGFRGVTIKLAGEFCELDFKDEKVLAGAGVFDFHFSRFARLNSQSGAEFFATIPGTIGGAIYMNAGAHGMEVSDILEWVEFLDDEQNLVRINNQECTFSYRFSTFMKQRHVIVRACFKLVPGMKEKIKSKESELLNYRKSTQPWSAATFGSTFVNPENGSAGKIIEELGLKNNGFGNARISPKHANFVENIGNATSNDVLKTIQLAHQKVLEEKNINLRLEPRVLDQYGKKVEFL